MATGSPSSVVALNSGPISPWEQRNGAGPGLDMRPLGKHRGSGTHPDGHLAPGPAAVGGFSIISSLMSLPPGVQALRAHTANKQVRRRIGPPGAGPQRAYD
jgi:hypothetical protein